MRGRDPGSPLAKSPIVLRLVLTRRGGGGHSSYRLMEIENGRMRANYSPPPISLQLSLLISNYYYYQKDVRFSFKKCLHNIIFSKILFCIKLFFLSKELFFRSKELFFRSKELFFQSKELFFRSKELFYRSIKLFLQNI